MDRFYIAVRGDLTPGLQAAQSVHASTQFFADWPSLAVNWLRESNFLVIVSVPDEGALAQLAESAVEEGIVRTIVREPDLDNTITAVALEPGATAQRLCAQMPLALKLKVKGDLTMV
jgi:peptidyl-tRNA hydrolase